MGDVFRHLTGLRLSGWVQVRFLLHDGWLDVFLSPSPSLSPSPFPLPSSSLSPSHSHSLSCGYSSQKRSESAPVVSVRSSVRSVALMQGSTTDHDVLYILSGWPVRRIAVDREDQEGCEIILVTIEENCEGETVQTLAPSYFHFGYNIFLSNPPR